MLERPSTRKTYRLGPGDHVDFAYNLERSREKRLVKTMDAWSYPDWGAFPPPAQSRPAARDNARRLSTLFRADSVDLWIVQPRTIRVQISEPRTIPTGSTGLLHAPKTPPCCARWRRRSPRPEAELPRALRSPQDKLELSWRNVRVLRGEDTLSVDLLRRLRTGDPACDPILEGGRSHPVSTSRDAVLGSSGPFRRGRAR